MRIGLVVIVLCLMATAQVLRASQPMFYLEFNVSGFAELERQLKWLESTGVQPVHIFPPNGVIVEAPAGLPQLWMANPAVTTICGPESKGHYRAEPANLLGFAAWQHLQSKDETEEQKSSGDAPLSHCVRRFTGSEDSTDLRSPLTNEPDMFTSNYLIGRVAVRLILMESAGDAENWQGSEVKTAVSEIVQGLNFLRNTATSHGAKVEWVYEIHQGVPTGYEPISNRSVPYYSSSSMSWHFDWIDDALAHFGFGDKWDGVFAMANALRQQYHANWGLSVFVVMDKNDADHMFADTIYAYVPSYRGYPSAPYNACFAVMTYNNYLWTPAGMDRVLSHEMVHVFRGADEYRDGCEEDDCGRGYGYLQVANANCEKCNDNPVFCIMRGQDYNYYCSYSLGHLGWRDTDGDGVCDPIQPSNGGWMSILNVNPGDLVRIYTIAGDFVNLISVTSDNMATQPVNYVIWDGHNYDDQICATHCSYLVSINGGSPFTRWLNGGDPSNTPVFTDISYTDGSLRWNLDKSFAYVRCFIYDSDSNLIARPIWDKLYTAHYAQTLDMDFLSSGQTYTARFYAWCPDGGKSQTVNYTFTHQCTHCGDADNSGAVDIADPVFIISHIFSGGAAPLDCGYAKGLGDANGDGTVDISDGVYLISHIFAGGAAPHCFGM